MELCCQKPLWPSRWQAWTIYIVSLYRIYMYICVSTLYNLVFHNAKKSGLLIITFILCILPRLKCYSERKFWWWLSFLETRGCTWCTWWRRTNQSVEMEIIQYARKLSCLFNYPSKKICLRTSAPYDLHHMEICIIS